jgi:hypothetical protein
MDALGNIIHVNEPNPADSGPDYITTYKYL